MKAGQADQKTETVARQDWFLILIEEHKKILFKAAALYCRDRADFADVVQEMVLQAWRSFERYDESRRFSTWLYRIALNVAISFYRIETRRSRTLVPADDSIVEIAAPSAESVEFEERLRLLRLFIDRLSDFDKALVFLYLDGNSYEVIAGVLGISETNAATRMNRIKRKLQRSWADVSKQDHSYEIR